MQSPSSKRGLNRFLAAAVLAALFAGLAVPVSAEPAPELASETAVLIDADSGQILYQKDMHKQMYPASITKVMTAYLALKYRKPEDVLTVSEEAVNAVPRDSSHAALVPGEEITVDNALYALAIGSANDASNVLAEGVSGSLEAFAQKMNEEAAALGAQNTHFANANGLPNTDHYTSAYDMALITAAALKLPGFTTYFNTQLFSLPTTELFTEERNMKNANRILFGEYHYDGVLMSKTGWTSAALGTLITAAKRGNTTLVAVVMKSVATESKYQDTWALFDYGFSQYAQTTVSGKDIASNLDLGEFVPPTGLQLSYLLPVGTAPGDITFRLDEAADLAAVTDDETSVTLHASLGDTSLPDKVLTLERKKPEPETVPPAPTQAEETRAEKTESTPQSRKFPIVPLIILLLVPAVLLIVEITYRRQFQEEAQQGHVLPKLRKGKKKAKHLAKKK